MREIYFDHAATTPPDERVVEAMLPYLRGDFGNPSEPHRLGRRANRAVAAARAQTAAALGAEEDEIVFTGGGSEADSLAIVGHAETHAAGHLITSAVEHPAVAEAVRFLERYRGWEPIVVPVDRDGVVDLDAYTGAFRPDTRLVSVMLANNVVGTLQPIAELARIAHEHGAVFHTDAVQAVGSLEIDVRRLDVDLLSLSGHKLYGPKGVGALYVRRGIELVPVIHGGGQEHGLRSGTENVPSIVGLGKALELAVDALPTAGPRLEALRDRLIEGVLSSVPEVELLGHRRQRLPGNVCLSVRGVEGEALVLRLDELGISASSGSACSARSEGPGGVIVAMGRDKVSARGSLRLTLGRATDDADVDYFLEVFPGVVERLRAMSPLMAGA